MSDSTDVNARLDIVPVQQFGEQVTALGEEIQRRNVHGIYTKALKAPDKPGSCIDEQHDPLRAPVMGEILAVHTGGMGTVPNDHGALAAELQRDAQRLPMGAVTRVSGGSDVGKVVG